MSVVKSGAFVQTGGFVGRNTSTFMGKSAVSPAVSPRPSAVLIRQPRALLDTKPQQTDEKKKTFTKVEDSRKARVDSQYRGVQGFTPYAETVNGRLAQVGFVIGLVTEVFSQDHLTIGQQILLMFSPLTNAVGAFAAHAGTLLPPGGM